MKRARCWWMKRRFGRSAWIWSKPSAAASRKDLICWALAPRKNCEVTMNIAGLEKKALAHEKLTEEEALSILYSSEDQLLDLVAAAKRVREKYFGRKVKLNHLVNVKSGLCAEDCHYCSQSKD